MQTPCTHPYLAQSLNLDKHCSCSFRVAHITPEGIHIIWRTYARTRRHITLQLEFLLHMCSLTIYVFSHYIYIDHTHAQGDTSCFSLIAHTAHSCSPALCTHTLCTCTRLHRAHSPCACTHAQTHRWSLRAPFAHCHGIQLFFSFSLHLASQYIFFFFFHFSPCYSIATPQREKERESFIRNNAPIPA